MVRHTFSIVGSTNCRNARSEAAKNRTRNPCALCQQDRKKCSGGSPCQRCLIEKKKPEECKPGTSRRKSSFIIISGPSAMDAPGSSIGSRPTSMDSQKIPESTCFPSVPREIGAYSVAHGTRYNLPSSAPPVNRHGPPSDPRHTGVGLSAPEAYDVSHVGYGGSSNNWIGTQWGAGGAYGSQQQNNERIGFQDTALGQCSEYFNVAFNQQRDMRVRDRQQRATPLDTTQQNMIALSQGTYSSTSPETVYPRPQPVDKRCDGQPWTFNKSANDLLSPFSTVSSFDQLTGSNLKSGVYQSFGYMDSLADFPFYRQSGSNGDSA